MHIHSGKQIGKKVTAAFLSIMMAVVLPATSSAATYNFEAGDQGYVSSTVTDGQAHVIPSSPAKNISADVNTEMDEGAAVSGELLVLAKKGTSEKKLDKLADHAGATVDDVELTDEGTKLAKLDLNSDADAQAAADELVEEKEILFVQPNYIYSLAEEAPTLSAADKGIMAGSLDQWYMGSSYPGATGSFDAWTGLSSPGSKVRVAVIDTGAKLDHPDISGSINRSLCVSFRYGVKGSFTDWDGSDDDDGHGTHVCGIIAANTKDGSGISGMSRDSAELIVIDATYDSAGHFTTLDVINSINYAVSNGASIINMSLGGPGYDYFLESSIDSAFDRGVLCVCAAGNDYSLGYTSPSDCPSAIGVMSHDENGNRAASSNYGVEKDISAPGVDIVSTYIDDKGSPAYYKASGTSMAAPMVTGLAALLKSQRSSLTPRQLKNLIYTGSYTGSGNWNYSSFGFGRISAPGSLNSLRNMGSAEPQAIVLNRTATSGYPGDLIDLEYAIYPRSASAHAGSVAFTSSNPAVATVDGRGRITARGAGTAIVTAHCRGVSASCPITVYGLSNPMSVKGKKATVKYSALRKKARSLAGSKVLTVRYAQGRLSYAKVSGSSRFKINKSTGRISIRKKTKKGTYRLRIRVTAAGNASYYSASRIVTVKIRVK